VTRRQSEIKEAITEDVENSAVEITAPSEEVESIDDIFGAAIEQQQQTQPAGEII
jgi:hypothetical protein